MAKTTLTQRVTALETKMDSIESKLDAILAGQQKNNGGQKKSAKKAAKKDEKPMTKKEAIDAWCEKKGYSEDDRKAFGEAKRAERAIQKKAYEMTNAQFTEKVDYKVWRTAYEKNLKKLSK